MSNRNQFTRDQLKRALDRYRELALESCNIIEGHRRLGQDNGPEQVMAAHQSAARALKAAEIKTGLLELQLDVASHPVRAIDRGHLLPHQ